MYRIKVYVLFCWTAFFEVAFYWQVFLPFDVLLTTYDIALIDQDFLAQIPWHYAIIDEAQRLKNPSSVSLLYDKALSHMSYTRKFLWRNS